MASIALVLAFVPHHKHLLFHLQNKIVQDKQYQFKDDQHYLEKPWTNNINKLGV